MSVLERRVLGVEVWWLESGGGKLEGGGWGGWKGVGW